MTLELNISPTLYYLIVALAIWTIPWKGYALWLSSQKKNKIWFIVLLFVNTVGLLEIFYIFFIAKKSDTQNPSEIKKAGTESEYIQFDDFTKVEFKIGEVIKAEEIPNAEKLLKLSVDLGNENRQIIAGIKSAYSPDELVGKQVVIVANLEPKSMMGLESQGMILAADSDRPVLISPEVKVKKGAKVR